MNRTVSLGAKAASSDIGIASAVPTTHISLAPVAVAERAEPQHRACQAERVADGDQVEHRLARVEVLADRRQRDVGHREVQVRDRRDQDQGREHQARALAAQSSWPRRRACRSRLLGDRPLCPPWHAMRRRRIRRECGALAVRHRPPLNENPPVNPELFILALASTFRLASLAAVYALLQRDSAPRLLVAYIIGGLAFVFAVGAVVVLALHGVEVQQNSPRLPARRGADCRRRAAGARRRSRSRAGCRRTRPVSARFKLGAAAGRPRDVRGAAIAGVRDAPAWGLLPRRARPDHLRGRQECPARAARHGDVRCDLVRVADRRAARGDLPAPSGPARRSTRRGVLPHATPRS